MGIDFEEEFKDLLINFDDCNDDGADDDVIVSVPCISCFVDIVLCIDVTSGMTPVLNSIKKFALDFYDNVITNASKQYREIKQLRIKVIAFRDYYCDGPYAMEESRFFFLPVEKTEFYNFVSSLEAKGGGDEPENALESIALAMKSDWVCEAWGECERERNIIIVFTDAPSHPLEKYSKVVHEHYPYYPTEMIETYEEFIDAWQGGRPLGCPDWPKNRMSHSAQRMIVYAPQDVYPWNDLMFDLEMTLINDIKELTTEKVLSDINSAIV